MKRKITPQEKKIRNYTRQRKNSFGENDKCSRDAIRKRKRWVNRAHRREVHNIEKQRGIDWDEMDAEIKNAKRHTWKKSPDELVLYSFTHKWSGSSRTKFRPPGTQLKREAVRRLMRAGKNI